MRKLTLSAEPDVIETAKKLAEMRGTSVSGMFSELIRAMADEPADAASSIGPITRRLTGIARGGRRKTQRQLVEEALLERYTS